MTDLNRRQVGIGALSILAVPTFPAPIANALAAFDAGDQFERAQSQWMRDIAEAYAEFRRVDRDFFVTEYARHTWCLAHYELASQSQMLRADPLGDSQTRKAIRDWLDTLYPSPARRAYHVPKPLTNLSRAFAKHQSEFDALTMVLGAAEYKFAQYKRERAGPYGSKRYRELWRDVSRALDKQNTLTASFSQLHVDTVDDKTAALRATMIYHSCYSVRGLNARRTWWLRSHARS